MKIFGLQIIELTDSSFCRIIPLHVLLFFLFSLNIIPFTFAQSPENRYKFSGNINHSMSIILVALVCSFFVMGFFAVYIRHCMDVSTADSTAAVLQVSEGDGLNPELIQKFPIIVYSEVKDLKIGKVQLECAVCLNEFEDYESLRLLTNCDHVFHPPCIDVWLASHVTCPVCRTILLPGSDRGANAQQPVSDESNSRSPLREVANQVSINIVEYPTAVNRPPILRSASMDRKFPRSNSTGHSLVQHRDDLERYTLRLPEQVLKQLAMNSELNREKSHGVVVLPRVESSRKGYRNDGEESGRISSSLILGSGRFDRGTKSDRWLFTMSRPFFSRGGSVKSPKMDANGEVIMARSFTRL